MKKILCFFGTRPEAIKMAPVIQELKSDRRLRVITVVSAQHREMLDQVLGLFGIRPELDLNLMQQNQTPSSITARLLQKFEPVLERIKPDLVLVHGDTTTTLGGTLASFYKRIPVGHVEAGLRTHDFLRPFPEEMNRRLTDAVTALHFAPTKESARNLKLENADRDRIFITGNTVIDALLTTAKKPRAFQSPALRRLLPEIQKLRGRIILMTSHRRENFGKPFRELCEGVVTLAERFADLHWIYPVHPNPQIQKPAHQLLGGYSNIHLISPIGYADLVELLKKVLLVVTDSGGLQEEAPALGKPVFVLREVTERPEAVRAGTVRLVGTDKNKIVKEISRVLMNKREYRRMSNAVNPYGDGRASKRILQGIQWFFGFRRRKPRPFEEK